MSLSGNFVRLLCRFRHPFSLPEEVAEALGVELSNRLTIREVLGALSDKTSGLERDMPRVRAEKAFKRALRSERFRYSSLFSYYFAGGWMEFSLHFDENDRLRRLYVLHKEIPEELGLEMQLTKINVSAEKKVS